jgi:hypothetical protein
MVTFDKVPVLDREAFYDKLTKAESFGVWVQLNQGLQHCLPITRDQAVYLAEYTFSSSKLPIYGQLCEGMPGKGPVLELSNTSQWLSRIYEVKPKEPASVDRTS